MGGVDEITLRGIEFIEIVLKRIDKIKMQNLRRKKIK